MNILKRSLAMILVLCMMLGMVPLNVFAEESGEQTEMIVSNEDTVSGNDIDSSEEDFADEFSENLNNEEQDEDFFEEEAVVVELTEKIDAKAYNNGTMILSDATAAKFDEFVRAFALDCGRLYFSVDQIKTIIDVMAKNDYTHLTLAFGNSGFRFLLDDMTIGSYSSEAVKEAILAGNTYYTNNDGHNAKGSNSSNPTNACLNEDDMDTIIAYANDKGISIIPALNSPGHMNTIVYAMEQLGISNAGYPVSASYNSESTININNATVTEFVNELIQKYINYFADKGCTMFNLGADEFANDPTDNTKLDGFTSMSTELKNSFINYVNNVATMISNKGMIPMMFNDGYAWSDANFNKDIVVCYWTNGAVSSTAIANAGHNVINNSQSYYYVLGEPFGTASNSWCSYASATNGVNNVPVTQMVDGGSPGEKLVGAQMFLWCDYTDEVYDETEAERVVTLISTLAEKNPSYFTISEEPAEPETRTVTMQVNQVETDTISDYTYTEYKIEDESVVSVELETIPGVEETTVSTTKTAELEDGATYILRVFNTSYALSSNMGRGDWGTNTLAFEFNNLSANTAHLWTLEASGTGYKLKNDNGYLNLGTGNNAAYLNDTGEVFTITYTDTGWTIKNSSGKFINALGGLYNYYSAGGWTGDGTRLDFYKVTTAGEASTEVTFTGLTVGTTTVTVGHVTYNVNVTAEDISNVILTYHPWISTYSVHPEGTGADKCNGTAGQAENVTISATVPGINSEQGTAISDLVWSTGDWRWEEAAQTVYWKATILSDGKHQQGTVDTDQSMNGTDFTYIRYWGGDWEYSSDRTNWKKIEQTDEVCVYYLQKTEVTQEVVTYVKDWAFTSTTASGGEANRYQKALSFAVVYPGGTMNPQEDEIYQDSTMIYYDNLADIGFIRVGINELFEVKKITYTFGERVKDEYSDTYKWGINDTIDWKKVMINDKTWYDETVCWDESYNTEPVVNGAKLKDVINKDTWKADDAVLILIYVEPVATEDSLKVVYYDERFDEILHSYNISVKRDVTFDALTPPPETFSGDSSRIDVSKCSIENSQGVSLGFETNLSEVPAELGKYGSDLYTYTGSTISDDGKTLYLYYNINTEVFKPNLVVDFGLPITFNLSDVTNAADAVEDVTVSAKYGEVVYDSGAEQFTYMPKQILQGIDVISVNIKFEDEPNISTTNVGITPATSVYYEENFLLNENSTGWERIANKLSNQETEILGNHTYNYGYDPAYIAKDEGKAIEKGYISGGVGASTSFTFTGTGFQLYGNSKGQSGYVTVYSQGKLNKLYMINTQLNSGSTAATNQQSGDTYDNLPFISETALPYGTYTVRIKQTNGEKAIYLDGVRIINTINDTEQGTNNIYYADQEDNPVFYELRDYVLNAIGVESLNVSEYINNSDRDGLVAAVNQMAGQVYNALSEGTKAVIINEEGTTFKEEQAQDLLDNGPKNELYLYPGQTLVFSVTTDRVMQLGMKSPIGNAEFELLVDGQKVKYKTSDTEEKELSSIETTTDMFYQIAQKGGTSHNVSIKVTEGVLSVTNLKICDDPNAGLKDLTEKDIEYALTAMGYTFPEEETKNPSKPSVPETTVVPEDTKEDIKEDESSSVPAEVVKVEVADSEETSKVVQKEKNATSSVEDEVNKSEEVVETETAIEEDAEVETETDIQENENLENEKTEESSGNPILVIGIAIAILAVITVAIFGFKKNKKK